MLLEKNYSFLFNIKKLDLIEVPYDFCELTIDDLKNVEYKN
jgi:hypothetical protein